MIMDHALNQAAQQGDITALYAAIGNDPYILDRIESVPFIDTPFHIAASAGQAHFAMELMMMKPSFAKKLNQSCYTPLHLASINHHEDLVCGLLSIDSDLLGVKGAEGRTPLHSAIIAGENLSLLVQMLSARPDSIKDLTFRRETALHLSVKHNDCEAFKVLVEHIKMFNWYEIYKLKDEEGYTALQQASIRKQFKMVEILLEKYQSEEWKLGIDVQDRNGRTVRGIIKEILEEDASQNRGRSIDLDQVSYRLSRLKTSNLEVPIVAGIRGMQPSNRDALLVVLTLVITASLQLVVNPPGGLWQDDGINNGKKHFAGTPVLATKSPALYHLLTFLNMAGYGTCVVLTFLIVVGMPMSYFIVIALTYLSYSYLFSIIALSHEIRNVTAYVCISIIVLLVLIFIIGNPYLVKRLKSKRPFSTVRNQRR